MTRNANARIAGYTFLLYIALGIIALVLFGRATDGQGIDAKLVGIAEHAPEVRLAVVLSLITCFAAIVLGVTLYGLTREEDHELAMLGMLCRVAEGVLGGASLMATLGLLWLGTASAANAPEPAAAHALAAYLLKVEGWSPTVSATFFAVGSTCFSWLLLRGRIIPVTMARLGVAASILLVAFLPFQLVGWLGGVAAWLVWLPMLVFEVVFALWLIIKGVDASASRSRG